MRQHLGGAWACCAAKKDHGSRSQSANRVPWCRQTAVCYRIEVAGGMGNLEPLDLPDVLCEVWAVDAEEETTRSGRSERVAGQPHRLNVVLIKSAAPQYCHEQFQR
jgi:hypothetical protein